MTVRHWTFEAIGTHWSIQAEAALTTKAWMALQGDIQERIAGFDKCFSRFRKDSWVSAIAAKPGRHRMPADARQLLRYYEGLYKATNGLVTPLIGQALADAGYDAQYSFKAKAMVRPPAWDEVLGYDDTYITMAQAAALDFGAAGKGYLVDIISQLIEAAGISDYTINASGDLLHRTAIGNPLTIGLENPRNTSEVIGTVELGNKSLCASAGSRRAWGKYHHIINPATLESPKDVIATWIIADDTMTADGLATALFFMPPQRLSAQYDFTYAVLHDNMSLDYDKDFPVTLFMAETT